MSNRPDGTEGPHVFVEDVETPALDDNDRHHLERVLRIRNGGPLTVGDGAGRWRACRYGPALDPDGPVVVAPPMTPALAVGFAVVKGNRPERVVAALTELGIDRIVPLKTERGVVRWDSAKAEKNLERLRRVVRESAMQSRRVWLPQVDPMTAFAVLASGEDVLLADPRAVAVISQSAQNLRAHGQGLPAELMVLIGPEGGWTDDERALVSHHIRLPGRILRAETASVVAAGLLAAVRDAACTSNEQDPGPTRFANPP